MASKELAPLADPDDMFADTRMSFGDHIEDLRWHLVRAVFGFVIAMVVCILPPVGPWAVKFITAPVEDQLIAFYDRYYAKQYDDLKGQLAKNVPSVTMTIKLHGPTLKRYFEGKAADPAPGADKMIAGIEKLLVELGIDPRTGVANPQEMIAVPAEIPDPLALSKAFSDITRIVRPERLSTMNVQEPFTVYVKVGLMVGFVVSSPWIFYQLWSFVAAGLYPHEKRLVNYYLPISLGLFLAGFFVCEFFALPKAIEALLWFNEWLGFVPELRLNEWLSFAIIMPLVFGLSFQTPIVMLFMFKIGVADLDTFRNKRRIAIFLMAVFAALITPSTDIVTWLLLWLPMCLLYEVGILLCIMQPKSLSEEMDQAELDEMVGV